METMVVPIGWTPLRRTGAAADCRTSGIRCAGAVRRALRRCRALIPTASVRRTMRAGVAATPASSLRRTREGDRASDAVHSMHPLDQVCRRGFHPVHRVESHPCPATSFPRSFDVSPWHHPLPRRRRPPPGTRRTVAEGRSLPPGSLCIITLCKGNVWCGRCRALWLGGAFHQVGGDATQAPGGEWSPS